MHKTNVFKRIAFLLVALAMVITCFIIVPKTAEEVVAAINGYNVKPYTGSYSSTNGTYVGVDDLGRELTQDYQTTAVKSNKCVGIFYFLWQGEHGTSGPYDNTKIVANYPSAINSQSNWTKYGGGGQGAHHFFGEPLFGYYTSKDEWVMRKHLQMLCDAQIDYICFDATNGYAYVDRVKSIIKIWYEYLEKGYKVPKLMFYTNTKSGTTMNTIYDNIYNSSSLKSTYPRLSELWFNWEGKPLIIGVKSEASSRVNSFFRVMASQWPNASKVADGFPWMEFSRLNTSSAVYTSNNGSTMMNVSVAQHNVTCRFSAAAWYGSNDRMRSYNNGANDRTNGAYLYGYNFKSQWEFALTKSPDMIFLTGWNEWVAQRQGDQTTGYNISGEPIWFVDCADFNASRDMEPMKGYYGDNYYMQMVDYIRKFKGTPARVNTGSNVTINVDGAFSQWDSSSITAKYTDYSNDIVNRSSTGFGGISYTDKTGRNDIVAAKVTKDANNIYFYVETASNITAHTNSNWMTLFLKVKGDGVDTNNWYGYNYAVNYVTPASATQAYLSKCTGANTWTTQIPVDMKIEGKKLMVAIPRTAIGMTESLFDIEFKWADNYTKGDIWSFYEHGDAAPYGRLNYLFSNCVKSTDKYYTAIDTPKSNTVQYGPSNGGTYTLQGSSASMYVSGWALHNGTSISSYFYKVDGKYAGTLTASTRSDVQSAITGFSNYTNCAYSGSIPASKIGAGTHDVAIYAKTAAGGIFKVAYVKATVADGTAPTISNIKVTDLDYTGYTVSCTVKDDTGVVSRVRFATWTEAGGQDDILWLEGTVNGNTASVRVNVADFKDASGNYVTHVYAYDGAGNSSNSPAPTQTVPALAYPTNGAYIPIAVLNGDLNNITSTVWTSNPANANFTATYWGFALCTDNGDGSYTVNQVVASGTSKVGMTVGSKQILIGIHSDLEAYNNLASLTAGDVITAQGVDVANGTLHSKGHFIMDAPFVLNNDSSYTMSAGIVSPAKASQTAANFIAQFKCDVAVVDANGKALSSTALVGTGCKVVRYDEAGTVTDSATVFIKGDVVGDGTINAQDALAASSHIKKSSKLSGLYLEATDFDANGTITTMDYIKLKLLIKAQ